MKNQKSTYQKLFRATLATTIATGAFVAAVPAYSQAEGIKGASFSDVKQSHQFYEAIKSLTSTGVINGFEDGTYKPGEKISRAHAAKIMALALDLDTKNVVDPGFKDVKKNHPYYGHIAALVNAGIIKGYEDNTFKPTGNLTRAHVAQMLVLGYKLEEKKLSNLPFKDVNDKQWFANYIQTLFANDITSGTTATTFSPNAFVTRGQAASFIFKSKLATPLKGATVISIAGDKVEFSDGTYTLPAILKDMFSDSNLAALKGAVVKYTAKDGVLTGISSIEIKANGTAENNLVLDGKGLTFPGNLTVNGDYISLKNLTIKGNLEIGKEVKNGFTSDKITVEGKTIISDKAATAATASFSVAAVAKSPTITFTNSTMGIVEVTKKGVTVEAKGSTKVSEMIVSSNVTIKADAGITIPKVTVKTGATEVTLDANVGTLLVNSTGNLTLAGTGNIKEAIIESKNDVKFETKGKIDKLEIKSKDSKVSLGAATKVGSLVVPEGSNVKDIILDYDKVKGNVEKIGDKVNPDATPPAIGGGGGGGTGGGGAVVTGNDLLNQKLHAQIGAGNTATGNTVGISFTGNSFNVKINTPQSKLQDFYDEANKVFIVFKSSGTVVDSATVTYTSVNNESITIGSNSNGLEFDKVIEKALAKFNFTGQESLTILKDRTITLQVSGTIDGKGFNAGYDFNFK